MHLAPLLTILATLCSITTAIPLGQDQSQPTTPTPSTNPSASASHTHSATAPVRTPVGPYQCPQEQYKACCQSLEQTTQDVFTSLGEVLPMVGGIQVSSKVSFQCNRMTDNADPATCKGHGYTPMCCSNKINGDAVSSCKSFESAKEKYYQSLGYNVDEESTTELVNDVMS
ncbi:hypothetical protein N7466_000617 [Penicillium verhagenii]|uniref:uncharacterized protein n=1 Tax=Penicillium verhagenii TaxID=1562060 RepID=UPI002545AAC3|nr:uncharacterized protein N7466_000617 [Penicillium verhagenii]KAJ5947602.1 hypothetical protein N7466_000617 [Penicillium verhagenii]